jgi:uncharacterized protein (DUF2141 family)
MKNKVNFLLLIISFFLSSNNSIGQRLSNDIVQKEHFILKIQVIGLKSNKGKILLQVLNEKDKPIIGKTATIHNKECNMLILDLKIGKYSIRYFHDENGNCKLDTNLLGLPKEGYGFSNNATSMFGTPSIKERLFIFISNKSIVLKISK